MPCPTCDHTMAKMTMNDPVSVYGCGRCGTIVTVMGEQQDVYRPQLVLKCREFASRSHSSSGVVDDDLWISLGIAEAINLPGER